MRFSMERFLFGAHSFWDLFNFELSVLVHLSSLEIRKLYVFFC